MQIQFDWLNEFKQLIKILQIHSNNLANHLKTRLAFLHQLCFGAEARIMKAYDSKD